MDDCGVLREALNHKMIFNNIFWFGKNWMASVTKVTRIGELFCLREDSVYENSPKSTDV